MTPEIVVEEERLEYVLEPFGFEVNENNVIVDSDTQEPAAVSREGEPIRTDNLGMLGHGSVEFVEDDLSELTSFLRGRERQS